jgi:hypothetical protein
MQSHVKLIRNDFLRVLLFNNLLAPEPFLAKIMICRTNGRQQSCGNLERTDRRL